MTEGSVKCYHTNAFWVLLDLSVQWFPFLSVISHYHATCTSPRRLFPQYYLPFLLSLLSVAYSTFNSSIDSSLLWTSQPSRVFQGNIFCEHVRSQLQVTNVYRHFAIWGWNHHFSAILKMDALSDMAIGYCYWLLTHFKLYWWRPFISTVILILNPSTKPNRDL